MQDFILKDNLCHAAYSFPNTLLCYEQTGETPRYGVDILCKNGEPVPYQTETLGENRYDLKIVSDLPTGGEYVYEWKKGGTAIATPLDGDAMDNGIIRVDSVKNGLATVSHRSGAACTFSLQTKKTILSVKENISGGRMEKTLTKELRFTDGSMYIFSVVIKNGLDYAEILEDMRGWVKDETTLSVTWTGFEPRHRYTHKRQEEKIDEYFVAQPATCTSKAVY